MDIIVAILLVLVAVYILNALGISLLYALLVLIAAAIVVYLLRRSRL